MGDRVIMQIVQRNRLTGDTFGPMVYGHWAGHSTPDIVEALATKMQDRLGDVAYQSARLVQMILDNGGSSIQRNNCGIGLYNSTAVATVDDSHGDAGVVLIDADTFKCECFGGYLRVSDDGRPLNPEQD